MNTLGIGLEKANVQDGARDLILLHTDDENGLLQVGYPFNDSLLCQKRWQDANGIYKIAQRLCCIVFQNFSDELRLSSGWHCITARQFLHRPNTTEQK